MTQHAELNFSSMLLQYSKPVQNMLRLVPYEQQKQTLDVHKNMTTLGFVLTTEGERNSLLGEGGGRNSSGHHCMSGIYNIEYYVYDDLVSFQTVSRVNKVFTYLLILTCLFQLTLHHNESCEREAG